MSRSLLPLSVVPLIAMIAGVSPALAQKPPPVKKSAKSTAKPPIPIAKPTDADLMEALKNENVPRSMNLLRRGANPNALTKDKKNSALGYAAETGDRELVLELLKRGAHVNPKNPLTESPLVAALVREQMDIARLLMERGANVNPENTGDLGERPLTEAVALGDLALVKLILNRGGEINYTAKSGTTALAMAAAKGNLSLMQFLLSRGARIDKAADTDLWLLKGALVSGKLPVVELVLAKGYTLQEMTSDLLLMAIRSNAPEVIKKVLDAGADLEAPDREGNTPLFFAINQHKEQSVLVLLDKKAQVNRKNKDNKTSLDLALMHDKRDPVWAVVLLALRKAGAKTTPPFNDMHLLEI
jgi:ankyrin repeat protein